MVKNRDPGLCWLVSLPEQMGQKKSQAFCLPLRPAQKYVQQLRKYVATQKGNGAWEGSVQVWQLSAPNQPKF